MGNALHGMPAQRMARAHLGDGRLEMVELSDGAAIRPGEHAAVVTPNDSTDLAAPSRLLIVGGSGDLRVTMVGGETVTIPSMPAGAFPLAVKRVFSASTTATDITAIW